jgi:hypothetical protein
MKAVNHALRNAQTMESLDLLRYPNVRQIRCVGIGVFTIRDCYDSHWNACPTEPGN